MDGARVLHPREEVFQRLPTFLLVMSIVWDVSEQTSLEIVFFLDLLGNLLLSPQSYHDVHSSRLLHFSGPNIIKLNSV